MDRCRRPRIDSGRTRTTGDGGYAERGRALYSTTGSTLRGLRKIEFAGGRRCDLLPDREMGNAPARQTEQVPNFSGRLAKGRDSAPSTAKGCREVRLRAGGQVDAQCYYCGAFGQVHWHKLSNGRPSGWVTFPVWSLITWNPRPTAARPSPRTLCSPVVPVTDRREPSLDRAPLHGEFRATFAIPPEHSRGLRYGKERNRERKGTGRKGGSFAFGSGFVRACGATLDPPKPTDLTTRKAERIRQIAEDAQAAYNRIPAKPTACCPHARC